MSTAIVVPVEKIFIDLQVKSGFSQVPTCKLSHLSWSGGLLKKRQEAGDSHIRLLPSSYWQAQKTSVELTWGVFLGWSLQCAISHSERGMWIFKESHSLNVFLSSNRLYLTPHSLNATLIYVFGPGDNLSTFTIVMCMKTTDIFWMINSKVSKERFFIKPIEKGVHWIISWH